MDILLIVLKLDPKPGVTTTTTNLREIIEDQPGTEKIFSSQRDESQFKFHAVSKNKVRKFILNLDKKR